MRVAEVFLYENMPAYSIKPVARDGSCILRAFQDGLRSISRNYTLDDLKQSLQCEIASNTQFYKDYSTKDVDLLVDVRKYIENPLANYSSDSADMYITALARAIQVNAVVFQSTVDTCLIVDQGEDSIVHDETLYFLRTESMHIDPILPNITSTGTCPEVIVIEDAVTDCTPTDNFIHFDLNKTLPEELESQRLRSPEDLPLNISETREFCNLKESQNPRSPEALQLNISETGELRNLKNPSSQELFKMILTNPTQYEVQSPLKSCRENTVYTVKNCTLDEITCDDNGAYIGTNTSEGKFAVLMKGNSISLVKGVTSTASNTFVYRERVGRVWEKKLVLPENVYLLHRYYRKSKSYPGLSMMVARIKNVTAIDWNEYTAVVYSMDGSALDTECATAPHGNSKRDEVFAQPYYRTSKAVLNTIDDLVEKKTPSSVFSTVLEEAGGPFLSQSKSQEPRNVKQVINRKNRLSIPQAVNEPSPTTNLEKLLALQRDPSSLVRTVLVYENSYIAFIYSDKQLQDMVMFGCKETGASVLGVDTTFNLWDGWSTDISYRNQRLLSVRSKKHPVGLGPVMLHFTKDEGTFRRFALELLAANPSLNKIKKIGVDMESAIFNGFKSVIAAIAKLLCVRHLRQRDEKAIEKCQESIQGNSDSQKEYAKSEVINDLYGVRRGDVFECGLADAANEDELIVKLDNVKAKWEKLVPGFHKWFVTHRKQDFAECVIKSAREGAQVDGLFYQNDVESQHGVMKRRQAFQKRDVVEVVQMLEKLARDEENEEVLALYGHENCVLAPLYKNWAAPMWHSWSENRRQDHVKRFRSFVPSLEDTFPKPLDVGRKPGFIPRARSKVKPSLVFDRHASSPATAPVTTSTTAISDTTQSSQSTSQSTPVSSIGPPLSFRDPRSRKERPFELHRKHLASARANLISTCRGDCGEPIEKDEVLVVKSFGELVILPWLMG